MTSLPAAQKPQRISDIMRMVMDRAAQDDSITFGTLLHMFGVRGFAFLLLILSLLNIVIFMIPFSSFLFGLPMVILSSQMMIGFHAPIFPTFLRRRPLQRETLNAGLERAVYGVMKIENYIRPRATFLTLPPFIRVHGLLALMLAAMVTLPVPLFNVPPSVGLAFLAIGILERDGLFVVLSYAIGFGCVLLFRSLLHLT